MARKFGEIAVDECFITDAQLKQAMEEQSKRNAVLGEVLVRLGFIDQRQRDQIMRIQFDETQAGL
jgi:2-oxoglutarate dehydrogenase complex dehydrogenase (E1) component-like enzyme